MESGEKKSLFQILQKTHVQGEVVPTSAIYECTLCHNITAFKQGEKFTVCPDCEVKKNDQGWYKTNELLYFVSKNLNTEFAKIENFSVRLAELIADFAGNIWFAWFHVFWFAAWIWMNTGHPLFGILNFDPYPFPFLVLVVSLEAIFLATFILIAQNILYQRGELRADLDYQTNIKVEKDVAEMLSILNDIREGRLTIKGKKVIFGDAAVGQDAKKRKKH